MSDSLLIVNDTIPKDSIPTADTLKIIEKKNDNAIDREISFEAVDSMHISVADKKIILFGKGILITDEMELNAGSIGVDMEKKEIMAVGVKDSLGRISGKPIFKEQDKEYSSTKMRYNFKTKKGIVYDAMTQEQEGFLHGEIVKIHSNDEMHILHGKYTTCNHPNPHYYVDLTKAKLKSKDKIITGPFYFVIEDIPIPIAAPFGFFPLSRKNTSGIQFPTYKDEIDIGFGLVGAGYYWAINDYVDADITADVYSKGSWGVHLNSRFKKRYKFNGGLNFNYFHKKTGPKELSTTEIGDSYNIQLNYQQDPKARPNSNISANINYVYGDYRKYNATDLNDFVNTTTNSSMSYQKTFAGTPFRMTANMNMSQNLQDSTTNLKFPTLNFNMNQVYFADIIRGKNKPKKGKWYEKVGFSVNSQLSNSVYTHDTILTNIDHIDSTLRAMKSGFKYSIPIQTSFTLFKYFNFSPSINYNARIYANRIEQNLISDGIDTRIVKDTIWGFNHVYDYSTSLSMNTRLYSMLNLNIGKFKAIRHVISPSVSYTYKPDFSDEKYGYYEKVPLDTTGKLYSFYDGTVFGTAPIGEQQALNFSVGNNIEAKIETNDSIENNKKIKLFNSLSFSESYNFAADSLNFSVFSIRASSTPITKVTVSFNASIDPYTVNESGQRINTFVYEQTQKIGRLTNADFSVNSQFTSIDLDKILKTESVVKWNASANYSFRYVKKFNTKNQDYDIDIVQNLTLNFNISPTPLWNVSVRTGYDFNASKITSTTFNFYRDLHCWEMTLQVTPFGQMRSYLFQIKVKSTMFEALQIKRENSWHDNF